MFLGSEHFLIRRSGDDVISETLEALSEALQIIGVFLSLAINIIFSPFR